MKIFVKSSLLLILLAVCTLTVTKVSANTLNDLYDELAELEAQAKEQEENAEALEAQKEATINEIYATNARIIAVGEEIDQTEIDIENTIAEIGQTEIEIEATEVIIAQRNEEIENLLRYFQRSKGISHYFQFLFGASDFNDLARRYVAVKRLGEYNNQIIDEMEIQLAKLEELKTDLTQQHLDLENQKVALAAQERELDGLKQDLADKLVTIGDAIVEIEDTGESIEHQINGLKSNITFYEDQGCERGDQLSSCVETIIDATKFYAPVDGGRITSNYGARTYWLNGRWVSDFHSGIDIANGYGSVYAAASGTVVYVYRDYWNSTPGGNCVIMNHIVDGVKYTTAYYHLNAIYVDVGEVLTNVDKIGQIGSSGTASTGAHLHFTITKNWRYGTGSDSYTSYSDYLRYSFDPRQVLNFPAKGSSWVGRDIGK